MRYEVTELNLSDSNEEFDFNIYNGGIENNGHIYFNADHSEKEIEKWQIIILIER